MRTRSGFPARSLVVICFAASAVWRAAAGTPGDRSALPSGLIRYDVPGGETLFALSLKAGTLNGPAAHDHVILFDTSASQAGAHRRQGLTVLNACLAAFKPSDRVRLVAVDTQVKPLADDFYAPQSAEIKSAVTKLRQRVPLGATSLQAALDAGLHLFVNSPSADRGRSITYIGDGMSTAKLIEWPAFRGLLAELRQEHIPVNSFAVGPRTDLQVLGVLAEHTGGVVFVDALVDDARLPAEKLGQKLAAAADAPVFYPESISLAPQADKLLPGVVPPLRSDRATILLGKGRVGELLRVTAAGERGLLSWSVKPAAAQPGNTFLAGLWNMAEQSDGLLVSVAGSELLNEARQEYESQVQELVAQGRAISKDVDLLDDERGLRAIRAEKLGKEVSRTIDVANKSGSAVPDSALGALKRALTTVISSNDIDPDLREKLRGKLQASIDRLLTAKERIEMDRIAALERSSATRAREMAVEKLVLRDEQLEQLISKVSSLIYEGYIGNSDAFERAEEVARASFELAPYAGVTSAAIFDAEAAGQLDKAQRLRYRRYDQFLAQLHQCEMAHIPFPDEPPIVYPAPEVWKSLTERRQKWRSVDVMRWNPTEEKIRRTLDKPTNVEFLDLALEDCIQYLQEYHSINIWLDKQTLTDEGVALDQPITLRLAGVTLRSVLKLLLEPVQLTYVIENEVMKITTATKAGEKLSTRVYPVADLVIPIITPRMGRGGMGMMGGMRGGMGGGMMGGMGGGMGGMGMGMMNIAEPQRSHLLLESAAHFSAP